MRGRTFVIVAAVVGASLALLYLRSASPPFEPVYADPDAAPPPAAWTVEVTYLANEGVLMTAGDTRVIIDGLFRQYRTYPYLPPPHRDQLEGGAPPFHGIDLVLVSHRHGDHFHPASVARHLATNDGAHLVAAEQIVSELQQQSEYPAIAARITSLTPATGTRVGVTAGGVSVEVLGLGHGPHHQDIQNLGYIVTVGGMRFLHLGDAPPSPEVFAPLNLADANIDVAFLPAWFLTEGASLVREHIRPKHIIAVHMSARMPDGWAEALASFPGATAFTRLLEKRYY